MKASNYMLLSRGTQMYRRYMALLDTLIMALAQERGLLELEDLRGLYAEIRKERPNLTDPLGLTALEVDDMTGRIQARLLEYYGSH